jgi:hypothetical protein
MIQTMVNFHKFPYPIHLEANKPGVSPPHYTLTILGEGGVDPDTERRMTQEVDELNVNIRSWSFKDIRQFGHLLGRLAGDHKPVTDTVFESFIGHLKQLATNPDNHGGHVFAGHLDPLNDDAYSGIWPLIFKILLNEKYISVDGANYPEPRVSF